MRRLLARYRRRPVNDYILGTALCLTILGVIAMVALRPAPAWVSTVVLLSLVVILLGGVAIAWRASSRR